MAHPALAPSGHRKRACYTEITEIFSSSLEACKMVLWRLPWLFWVAAVAADPCCLNILDIKDFL